MAITDDSCLLMSPEIIVPEKAAKNEITNVITEIQIFMRAFIFIPRMLYAILTPTLSKLFDKAMKKAYKKWCMVLLSFWGEFLPCQFTLIPG